MSTEKIKVCPNCGSKEVEYQYKCWKKVNGDKYASPYESDEIIYWCGVCESHPEELVNSDEYKTAEK